MSRHSGTSQLLSFLLLHEHTRTVSFLSFGRSSSSSSFLPLPFELVLKKKGRRDRETQRTERRTCVCCYQNCRRFQQITLVDKDITRPRRFFFFFFFLCCVCVPSFLHLQFGKAKKEEEGKIIIIKKRRLKEKKQQQQQQQQSVGAIITVFGCFKNGPGNGPPL